MALTTSTLIVHEAWPLDIVAPVTVMVPLPASAETAPAPLGQLDVMLSGETVTTFAGKVSVKLMPDCAGLPAPLVSVKVSVEVWFTSTSAGAKTFASVGCTTVSEPLRRGAGERHRARRRDRAAWCCCRCRRWAP